MKYFMLVWAGFWRKPTRTVLTTLSIVVAFMLFGLLQGINQNMNAIYGNLNVDRLYTENVITVSDGLPISYLERIKSIPGVRGVTHWTYFGGFYQEARNALPVFATDIAAQFAVYPDLKIPKAQLDEALKSRTGAIVGKDTAAKYGWKVGDKIPIGTSVWTKMDGSSNYQFDVVGIVDVSAYLGGNGFPSFYINYDYFDEARAFTKGMIHFFIASIDDPRRGAEIARAIDATFANSSYETKTQTEQAWAQARIKQIGDINTIANSIVGAVLFTLLFLTGNTMLQSVRERMPELAVLRTLGYSPLRVVMLVMVESTMLCVCASLVGLFFASLALGGLGGILGAAKLPSVVVQTGVGIALALAVMSGFPPALRAARFSVVDALANR